jgi:hypothetical protein
VRLLSSQPMRRLIWCAAAALLALRPVAAVQSTEPAAQPAAILENGELMELVIKPAYLELQLAVARAPADRKAWATVYQKAVRLAEMQNLLFFRNHETIRKAEWAAAAARSRQAAADVAAAALTGLHTIDGANYDAVRAKYMRVADACNGCHRGFGREAPRVKP